MPPTSRGLCTATSSPPTSSSRSRADHVYLSDFGLAKHREATGLTQTGTFMGSPGYCAPEQIDGRGVDGRVDVYALGCVLHHCLAGQPPFPRDSELAIIKAHLVDPPPPLSTVRPDLPRALDDVVATALAKHPDDRYPTAGALTGAVRSALTDKPGPAGVTRSAPRAHQALPPPPRATPPPQRRAPVDGPSPATPPPARRRPPVHRAPAATPPPRRRPPLFALAAGLLAVALAVAVAVVVTQRGAPEPEPAARAVSEQIAPRMDRLARRQRSVNRRLRAQPATPATLRALERAAESLRTELLTAQGFEQTLVARGGQDETVKRAFATALDRHLAYARALGRVPGDPGALTSRQTRAVETTGDTAGDAYIRLRGTAAGLPAMPLSAEANGALEPAARASQPRPGATASPATTTLTTFAGRFFSIDHPRDWRIETREVARPGFVDTTIRSPGDPRSTYIRVDYTPDTSDSLDEFAGEQRQAHREQAPGYTELAYEHVELAGHPAIRWEFEETNGGVRNHKIDTFVIDERDTGFAVLTQSSAAAWSTWEATFRRVTQSFEPHSP